MQAKDKNKEYYSWQKLDKDCAKIAVWAKKKGVKNVYGIPRGGLVPAVKLSHLLEIPQILNKEDVAPGTLVVDDIIDTGETVERLLFSLRNRVHLASLYLGKNTKVKPDFFLRKKKRWIIFPWETNKSSKYDFRKRF